jgi:hypothetical protein
MKVKKFVHFRCYFWSLRNRILNVFEGKGVGTWLFSKAATVNTCFVGCFFLKDATSCLRNTSPLVVGFFFRDLEFFI